MSHNNCDIINSYRPLSRLQNVLLSFLWALSFLLHFFPEFELCTIAIDKWAFIAFTIFSIIAYRNGLSDVFKFTPLKYLTYFGIVVCIVNTTYYLYFKDIHFLLNTCVICGIVFWYYGAYKYLEENINVALRLMVMMSLVGIGVTFLGCFFYEKTAFFTNVNQVTRAVLFFGCTFNISQQKVDSKGKEIIMLFVIAVSMILSFYLLRRAAIIGSVFLLVIYIYTFFKSSAQRREYFKILLVLLPLFCIIYISLYYQLLAERFLADSAGTTISGRGLSRILEDPHYLIYGAGDGKLDRFALSAGNVVEPHATLLYVWFTYGVLGFLSYIGYYFQSLKNLKSEFLLFLIPIFIHSLFHNDIRNIYLLVLPLLVLSQLQQKTVLLKECEYDNSK